MFTITVTEDTIYQTAKRYMNAKHPKINNYELDLSTNNIHHLVIWINNRFVVGWQANTLDALVEIILGKI